MKKIENSFNECCNFFIQKKIASKNLVEKKYKKLYKHIFQKNTNKIFKLQSKKINFENHLNNIKCLLDFLSSLDLTEFEVGKKINLFFGELLPNNEDESFQSKNLDYLYKISKASYYIKYLLNKKNITFPFETKYGKLEITINKAKPERINFNPNIEKKINAPKCLICYENIGWNGNKQFDSKENLRCKKIYLNNEEWFMQFSPFAYFHKHLIVISKNHYPMNQDDKTITRFIDFLKIYPNFFIGTNAGLPLIGGTMLNHNHFQAGAYELPFMKAKIYNKIFIKNVDIEFIDWPISTIKISSNDYEQATKIFNKIKNNYENVQLTNIPNHKNNALSVISKIDNSKRVNIWVTFRNNATSKKQPRGIYGIKKSRHNIKKESIGLIEVGGLAILPGRLENELKEMIDIYNRGKLNQKNLSQSLKKHYSWLKMYASSKDKMKWENIQNYIGDTFVKALADNDPFANKKLFQEYIKSIF